MELNAIKKRSDYVIWRYALDIDKPIVLNKLLNVDKTFELIRGKSRADSFSTLAYYEIDEDFKNNLSFQDNLNNIDRSIVASNKLSDFLMKLNLIDVEFLPVDIYYKTKKLSKDKYYIIHPIKPVNCMKIDDCKPTWGNVARDKIKIIERLLIDEDKIPKQKMLFRLMPYYSLILIHRSIANLLAEKKFTGIQWQEIEDYPFNGAGK